MPLSRWPLVAAALLLAGSLLLCWPGFATYDSVVQFGQALSGDVDDWHPPIMARLWQALHALIGGAGAPMLGLQLALYWLGLGLFAAGLGRWRAAVLLLIGCCPLYLGWQAALLKDAQMTAALIAAAGLVAEARLAERRIGPGRLATVAVLLGYAVLVRANAVFAALPLAVLLARIDWRWRVAALVVGTVAVLLATPTINHRLLGARTSGVAVTLPVFDLAGIASFGGTGALTPEQTGAVQQARCYRPFFWDTLGEGGHCGEALAPLFAASRGAMTRQWAAAIARHPLAYAGHRLAHLNQTERWLVPANLPSADPPLGSEANHLGLVRPGAAAVAMARFGAVLARTPLGWPFAWAVLGLAGLAAAWSRRGEPAAALALALIGSALALEASFAVVSIASDLRYHLWPMLAVAVAIALLADRAPSRRVMLPGGVALALVLGAGIAARIVLPSGPDSYAAMLA